MSTHKHVCKNPNCNKKYTLNKNDIDDGYCSFECWEEANCKTPKEIGDILEAHVEEILSNQN